MIKCLVIKEWRGHNAKEQAICVAVSQFVDIFSKSATDLFDPLRGPLIERDPQNELLDMTYFVQSWTL